MGLQSQWPGNPNDKTAQNDSDRPFVHNMDPSTLGFDGLHHIQGLLKPGFGSG